MPDIDTIREQHRPWFDDEEHPDNWCRACERSWPCHVATVLAALERAIVAAEEGVRQRDTACAALDAERAIHVGTLEAISEALRR